MCFVLAVCTAAAALPAPNASGDDALLAERACGGAVQVKVKEEGKSEEKAARPKRKAAELAEDKEATPTKKAAKPDAKAPAAKKEKTPKSEEKEAKKQKKAAADTTNGGAKPMLGAASSLQQAAAHANGGAGEATLALDNFNMHEKLKKQLRAKGIESLFQIQVPTVVCCGYAPTDSYLRRSTRLDAPLVVNTANHRMTHSQGSLAGDKGGGDGGRRTRSTSSRRGKTW
jgi:hypothetical protein